MEAADNINHERSASLTKQELKEINDILMDKEDAGDDEGKQPELVKDDGKDSKETLHGHYTCDEQHVDNVSV